MNHVINPENKEKLQDRRLLAENPNIDFKKRQFIKKGILGIIAGIGIAVFSKMTRAVQNIEFADATVLAGQATQSEIEGQSDVDKYAPPDLLGHMPGAWKFYCRCSTSGGIGGQQFNVASTAKNSTGRYTITIATDFGSADWHPSIHPLGAAVSNEYTCAPDSTTNIGTLVYYCLIGSTLTDVTNYVGGIGDQ